MIAAQMNGRTISPTRSRRRANRRITAMTTRRFVVGLQRGVFTFRIMGSNAVSATSVARLGGRLDPVG